MNTMSQKFLTAALLISLQTRAEMMKLVPQDQKIMVHDKTFVQSISHKEIKQRVKELAHQIDMQYAGKKPVLIGVLTGAFVFLSDLAKEMELDCEIDFIKLSSYGAATTSSGTVKLIKNLERDIAGRDVIIIEDIVDSGLTIKYARDLILEKNPHSVRTATFLHKNISNLDFSIDYVAFTIEPEFVVGYGLDYNQLGRTLKSVYKLVE